MLDTEADRLVQNDTYKDTMLQGNTNLNVLTLMQNLQEGSNNKESLIEIIS